MGVLYLSYLEPHSLLKQRHLKLLSLLLEIQILYKEMTFKVIMDAVCKTSIPFGCDDCEKSDTMKQVAVALFNKGGTKSYHGRNIPRTFPILTTNVDGKTHKVLSRWMRIPFETLDPLYKSKMYRDQCLLNANFG